MEKRYLNVKEVSAYTGFAVQTIYDWVHQRKIPFVKKGRLRFDKHELDKWMDDDSHAIVKDRDLMDTKLCSKDQC